MLRKNDDGGLPVPLELGEGLADQPITRARAIKLAGAMGAAGAFALFTGGTAEAGERDRRRRRRRRRRRIRREREQRQNNVTSTNTENNTFDFGDTLLETPVTRFVEIKNNGPDTVTLDPTVVGDGFTLADLSGVDLRLASGETARIPVVVNLLDDGVSTGTLQIRDAADNLLLETVNLEANGIL